MQVRDAHPNPLVSYAISGIVIAIVFALRWRGMNKRRHRNAHSSPRRAPVSASLVRTFSSIGCPFVMLQVSC